MLYKQNTFVWRSIFLFLFISFFFYFSNAVFKHDTIAGPNRDAMIRIAPGAIFPKCRESKTYDCTFPIFVEISWFAQYSPDEDLVPDIIEAALPRHLTHNLVAELTVGADDGCNSEALWRELQEASTESSSAPLTTLTENEIGQSTVPCFFVSTPGVKHRALLYWLGGKVAAWALCTQNTGQAEQCNLTYSFDDSEIAPTRNRVYWAVSISPLLFEDLHLMIAQMDALNSVAPRALTQAQLGVLSRLSAYSKLKTARAPAGK